MKTSEVIKLLGIKKSNMYDWLAKKKHGIHKDGWQYAWDEAAVEKARAHFAAKNKPTDSTFKSPDELFSKETMTYIRSRAKGGVYALPVEVLTEAKPRPVEPSVYAYAVNSVMNHLLMNGKIPPYTDPHVALRDSLIDALLSVTRVLIERK